MALEPTGVVTVMSTWPAEPAGEVAVMVLDEMKLNPVAATEPKLTPVRSLKPVPVMVTRLEPARGPAAGLMALTVGAAS